MGSATVIVGVSMATGLTVLNNLMAGKASFQPVIGGFVAGTLLLILSMFASEIAAALALLILVSSVLINADDLLGRVNK